MPCEKQIQFYERETWLSKFSINLINEGNPSEAFMASICCFSPDGKSVLATTNTQMIYIHSIINKSMLFKYSYTKKARLCSLAWNPTDQSDIIFCDINGYMGHVKPTLNDDGMGEENEPKKASKKDELGMDELLDLIDNEDSNTSEEVFKPKAKKKDSTELKSPLKKRKRLSDSETEVNCLEEELEMEHEDENEDDMESLEKLKEKTLKSVKKDLMMLESEENLDEMAEEEKQAPVEEIDLSKFKLTTQTPFQSGSTPLALSERYMAWNSIGLITQFMKEGDESIDIEFHNATYHHTIHIKNQYGYTMADMSKEAVLMGSPGKVDEEELNNDYNSTIASAITNQSKLACILINSCDNNKEWTLDMPRKEYIKCVAVSRHLAACMTNKRFLRIYGIAGTQKEIISFNGNPVAMAAYENMIFICYSSHGTAINYSLLYIEDELKREAETGVLPLGEGAKLEWVGFSDEGNPYYYDSNGCLFCKCLSVSKQQLWMPLSDMRFGLNHKSDNYWLVGVAERNQLVKAILCKASKYPQVLPRPTLSMVPLHIPFCEADSEKTKLEKDYWKNKHMSLSIRNYDFNSGHLDLDQEDMEEKMDKFEAGTREVLMKLFMFACKNSREQRAYEVASIMDSTALQLAIKYATKTRALVLAQNLNLLAEKKAALEYEKERCRQEAEETQTYGFNKPKYIDLEPEKTSTNMDQTTEVVFDEEATQMSMQSTATATFDESLMKSTLGTPSALPLTATRLNPFHKAKTPLNDASKSIINELEDKINKQQQQLESKEKNTWKPTPTRKLTKSKVSTNTPTSSKSSFFGGK